MKKIIRASWNGRYLEEDRLCRAPLQYRNTPSAKDGQSPAQKLYRHPVQDTIPAHGWSLDSTWQHSKEKAKDKAGEGHKVLRSEGTHTIRHQGRITCSNPTSTHQSVGYIWDSHLCGTTSPVLCEDQDRGSVEAQLKISTPKSSSIYTSTGEEHRIDTKSASIRHLPDTHPTTPPPTKIHTATEAHSTTGRRSFVELTIVVDTTYKLFSIVKSLVGDVGTN